LDEAVRDDLLEAPVEREQRVTALELFFDLVFVFAITQVTGFLYHDPTWTRVAEAFAILMVLWFAWTAYAWLGNTAGSDEGRMRSSSASRTSLSGRSTSSSTRCSPAETPSCVRRSSGSRERSCRPPDSSSSPACFRNRCALSAGRRHSRSTTAGSC